MQLLGRQGWYFQPCPPGTYMAQHTCGPQSEQIRASRMENPVMRITPLEDGDQENRSCFSGLSKQATMKRATGGKENWYVTQTAPKMSFFHQILDYQSNLKKWFKLWKILPWKTPLSLTGYLEVLSQCKTPQKVPQTSSHYCIHRSLIIHSVFPCHANVFYSFLTLNFPM